MTDSSNGATWVLSSKIEGTFAKVRDLQEFIQQYVLAANKLPVSVEDIQWAIESKYGLKIEKRLVDFEARHIRGMMERYQDGTAKVYVRRAQTPDPEQNIFWQRFISVKEMIHLAIDEPEDFSPRGTETIEELIRDHSFEAMKPAREEIQSEVLAELAAFELLYPMEFRLADTDAVTSYSVLAVQYAVPDYVIERCLSSGYMKVARATWNEVGGHGLPGIGGNPAAE